jgi:lipopolysaccharide transport system ATP-binding protein
VSVFPTGAAPDVSPSPAVTAIAVRDVTKKFRLHNDKKTNVKELFSARQRISRHDDFWALKGVSLDIPAGRTFGLIGHNGSGKSTLLKLVAGIHRPTSGTITSSGRVSAMLELGAGFHPEMSGRDNIYLNGSILGMTRRQIDAAMEEIIEFSGLGEFIDTPVKVYSSGMYVRLGFAIAVNLDPEILIIDEVIAVGDEAFQRRCFDHLYELRRKGVTIVLVTHSLSLVADLCDEAAWLDGGTLRAVGPAREIVDQYLSTVNEREAAADTASAASSSTPGTSTPPDDDGRGPGDRGALPGRRRRGAEVPQHRPGLHGADRLRGHQRPVRRHLRTGFRARVRGPGRRPQLRLRARRLPGAGRTGQRRLLLGHPPPAAR